MLWRPGTRIMLRTRRGLPQPRGSSFVRPSRAPRGSPVGSGCSTRASVHLRAQSPRRAAGQSLARRATRCADLARTGACPRAAPRQSLACRPPARAPRRPPPAAARRRVRCASAPTLRGPPPPAHGALAPRFGSEAPGRRHPQLLTGFGLRRPLRRRCAPDGRLARASRRLRSVATARRTTCRGAGRPTALCVGCSVGVCAAPGHARRGRGGHVAGAPHARRAALGARRASGCRSAPRAGGNVLTHPRARAGGAPGGVRR